MTKTARLDLWTRIASATLGLALLASSPAEARKKKELQAAPEPKAGISQIEGPKRTVAVADFNAKTDFLEQYGQVDLGGGLAAMLTTALVESGQFIVVERARLDSVLYEQELAAAGATAPGHDSPVAGLTGVQLLIMGSVTEFSQTTRGKGFGIGLGFGGRSGSLSPQSRTGTVAMDVRVIDTGTSEIVASYSVRESIKSRSLDLSFSEHGLDLSHSNFRETSLGQAARQAIGAAVRRFSEAAAKRRWTGRVVEVDEGLVAVNAGATAGVRVGDSFDLFRVTRVLTDPVTGRIIGRRQQALGTVDITGVDAGVAFGSFRGEAALPQRGDIVTSLNQAPD